MENKHIQNYQNENTNKKNRKINSGEIHIHKNECIKTAYFFVKKVVDYINEAC